MKAIIEGKRYDTETAEEIASLSAQTCTPGDFGYWRANLYRTRRGNWFLAGSGGPMSRWARTVGQNQWSGGSGIIPITAAEAQGCLETEGMADVVERYFPDTVEDA